ncbi:tetrahydromethanopterin S-methyltransferase subunit H [Peptococcaceae bacterium CEB3]|nr:tetrahydromethanopterin S-methyltransferase subunit H [Peptococcaceae bacterium CEB3]
MFTLKGEQKVCQIGPFKIGGPFGENPPLLISSMFHNGDRILESRKDHKFDHAKAAEFIKVQARLSAQTGIPALVAMVASSTEEMKYYIDFFTDQSDLPFGIDMWVQKPRLEAMEYVAARGMVERVLYNSITPWDKDIPDQVRALREIGVKHVVVQAFDENNQMPSGRLSAFEKLMEQVSQGEFRTILVDTAAMNLPATAFSCLGNKLIKEKYGWPTGVASSNGTFMWKEAREMWGQTGFAGMDAAGQALSALLWSDFIFYGPITVAPRIFPAIVSASLFQATLSFEETKHLPKNENHPIYNYFQKFASSLGGKEQIELVHGGSAQ